MTSSSARSGAVVAATVLTVLLTVSGCGSGEGGEDARTAPSSPATSPSATGTGPYPTPAEAEADASASASASDSAPASPGAGATGEPKGGTVRPEDVKGTDADAVSRGALKSLWTFDTAIDSGPRDAELRTAEAGWLTDKYADKLRADRPQSVPGAQWQEWDKHRAYTKVGLEQTEDAAKPADADGEAWRQWTVTTTPTGRDQWSGDPLVVTAYVQLTRTADGKPWRVADVTVA
ncbi:hypothetical protein [Streptomyces daliensis]